MNGGTSCENPLLQPISDFKADFVRVKELGRGKFGVVYEVKSKKNERIYAAKHIRARKRDVRLRVEEEIALLSGLSHPHILGFVAAFESPTEIVLLTEFLSGGELFERVAADQFELTEAECVEFARQICDGVGYLHARHVVHLDLKPENIVCCRQDSTEVKIIDFGLAKEIKPGEIVKVMCGTPEFVSPEVVNYDPVSCASDMWSVGVIAYTLLSGLSPFMGDNAVETYSNVSRAEYDFDEPEFDEISSDAKDFIGALLEKQPEIRLTADQCLQHAWLVHSVDGNYAKINKANLRRFLARRRWQRCGQAIRAMKRMSCLMQKRKSTQSMDSDTESLLRKQSTDSDSAEVTAALEEEIEEAQFVYARLYKSSCNIEIT